MYHYYSKPQKSNRITVVGEHTEGVLKIAVSRCSSKDNFCRQTGRAIAEDRLLKNETYVSVSIPECTTKLFILLAKGVETDVRERRRVYATNS